MRMRTCISILQACAYNVHLHTTHLVHVEHHAVYVARLSSSHRLSTVHACDAQLLLSPQMFAAASEGLDLVATCNKNSGPAIITPLGVPGLKSQRHLHIVIVDVTTSTHKQVAACAETTVVAQH